MFIEPKISWVSSELSRYRWLDTKIELKKENIILKNHACNGKKIDLNDIEFWE